MDAAVGSKQAAPGRHHFLVLQHDEAPAMNMKESTVNPLWSAAIEFDDSILWRAVEGRQQ